MNKRFFELLKRLSENGYEDPAIDIYANSDKPVFLVKNWLGKQFTVSGETRVTRDRERMLMQRLECYRLLVFKAFFGDDMYLEHLKAAEHMYRERQILLTVYYIIQSKNFYVVDEKEKRD